MGISTYRQPPSTDTIKKEQKPITMALLAGGPLYNSNIQYRMSLRGNDVQYWRSLTRFVVSAL